MRGVGKDPFGGFRGSFGRSFGGSNGPPPGFTETQPLSQPKDSHGPETDPEKEGEGEGDAEKRRNLGKHDRSSSKLESEVGSPSSPRGVGSPSSPRSPREGRNRKIQNNGQWQPRTRSYSFHTSIGTHGGYNISNLSMTKRTGSDGLFTHEESKEANTETREATHRISKSLHNKGHTVARKLTSDGRVDTTQTLHNLNEDEPADFEQSLSGGNARRQLPGRSGSFGSSGLVNREQSATDLSPSRARTESPRGTKAALNVTGHGRN